METDGENTLLSPNHLPLGNAIPRTKYVLLMNWMESKLHAYSHKISYTLLLWSIHE